MSNSAHKSRPPSELKRWTIKLLVALCLLAMAAETLPRQIPGVPLLAAYLAPTLNRLGLWQGQWTLFAPNPKINNAWLTAEVYPPRMPTETTETTETTEPTELYAAQSGSAEPLVWNSTFWAGTPGWERFIGFRHINYNNRIQTQGPLAAADLADYLARQLIGPTARPGEAKPNQAGVEHARATAIDPVANQWRLVLTRSALNMSLPEDGTLPVRDETLWISTSQNLIVREYQP